MGHESHPSTIEETESTKEHDLHCRESKKLQEKSQKRQILKTKVMMNYDLSIA